MNILALNLTIYSRLYILCSTQHKIVKLISLLDKIISKSIMEQLSFPKKEFKNTIHNCNNLSSPGLDHISQKHLKVVIEDDKCLLNIINIADTCIDQLTYFKTSSSIIIPKPNKMTYNSPKIFHPIVLLNTLRKLIKKVIDKRLQYQSIISNFVHSH